MVGLFEFPKLWKLSASSSEESKWVKERKGKKGKERKGKERKGKERKGKERKGKKKERNKRNKTKENKKQKQPENPMTVFEEMGGVGEKEIIPFLLSV